MATAPLPFVDNAFDRLVAEVKECRTCDRMCNSERVLGYASGSVPARVMFLGEAPGRLGADASQIPFHGDKAGRNFETFLEQVRISRYELFVTNAVLCNPRDPRGNNSTPTPREVHNCTSFLKRQIDLVNPRVVVTLGSVALAATSLVERHSLSLRDDVRRATRWYGRSLIPLYHPGQRAMVHRSFANQLADYQFVAEFLRRDGKTLAKGPARTAPDKTLAVVDLITFLRPRLSYFALHKLFYLVEVEALRRLGRRITQSYIVRQKDGPYCVDLDPAKLKIAIPGLQIARGQSKLTFERQMEDLFSTPRATVLSSEERVLVSDTLDRFGGLGDAELKRRAYLTGEMRKLLRLERFKHQNMFNVPILRP